MSQYPEQHSPSPVHSAPFAPHVGVAVGVGVGVGVGTATQTPRLPPAPSPSSHEYGEQHCGAPTPPLSHASPRPAHPVDVDV